MRAALSFVAVLSSVALGCGASPPHARLASGVGDYDTLVLALRAHGARVRLAGLAAQPFMPVAAQVLSVDGAHVQVFELDDEAGARAHAAQISPDASRIGTIEVSWPDPPHFYRAGRAIVLYVGDDADVLRHLSEVLGEPIAAGKGEARPDAHHPAPVTRA